MKRDIVTWLNNLAPSDAHRQFRKCCGAMFWCDQMAQATPFAGAAELIGSADRAFDEMPEASWLEAFASHPKLGDLDSLRMRITGNKQWSAGEQAGVEATDEQTLRGLAEGNRAYEERFGYTYILCATGLSADEMLEKLTERLQNDDKSEFSIACQEQRKITHLRLNKLTPGAPNAQDEQ